MTDRDERNRARAGSAGQRVYFSVEEANRLVPELATRFDVVMARIARIREIHHHLASLGGAHPGSLRNELLTLHAELASEVEAVQDLGAVVKDVEKGLVDFWHRRDGEDVQLCWRHGEAAIEWYHGETEGFAGRKPVGRAGAPPIRPPRSSSLH
jgi:hypothetical protein